MKGITLLFTILISSLVLILGLGVLSVLFGEISISGFAKESLEAFYAADTGMECALYWDKKMLQTSEDPGSQQVSNFATSTGVASHTITCSGFNRLVGGRDSCVDPATGAFSPCTGVGERKFGRNTFTLESISGLGNHWCARVSVEKKEVQLSGITILRTMIDSFGENKGCDESSTGRTLQRALQATY